MSLPSQFRKLPYIGNAATVPDSCLSNPGTTALSLVHMAIYRSWRLLFDSHQLFPTASRNASINAGNCEKRSTFLSILLSLEVIPSRNKSIKNSVKKDVPSPAAECLPTIEEGMINQSKSCLVPGGHHRSYRFRTYLKINPNAARGVWIYFEIGSSQ